MNKSDTFLQPDTQKKDHILCKGANKLILSSLIPQDLKTKTVSLWSYINSNVSSSYLKFTPKNFSRLPLIYSYLL